tara:strand:+ start:95 stop:400 length:306 start_codon:yes stop_codon:yes gene_type:complete
MCDGVFDAMAEGFSRMSCCGRCGILSACLGLVGLIIYIAVSLEGVEPTEYAIIQKNLDQSINEDRILSGGLHYVGVLYSLVKYPATNLVIEFSNDAKATSK